MPVPLLNMYQSLQSLQKSPIETGGLCALSFGRWEDVLAWPEVDPATGIITTAIQMKPNTNIYLCQAADKGRQWDEESKYEPAGPYVDITVAGRLGGGNTANLMSANVALFSRCFVIAKDRQGYQQLVGDRDSGAQVFYKYSTADGDGSRMMDIKFTWSRTPRSILYQAQNFQITIGGVIVTAGSLKKIISFQVGRIGSPMADGDSVYTNALALTNKKVLVLINSAGMELEDGSNTIIWVDAVSGVTRRHVEKQLAWDHINFIGAVKQDEIIDIYEIN